MRQAMGVLATSIAGGRSRAIAAVGAAAIALALVCLLAPAAVFSQALTGTFGGRGVGQQVSFLQNDRQRGAWAGTLKFRLETGEDVLVYCIQLNVPVAGNARYVDSGPVEDLPNGCQIRYILDEFPASDVTEGAEGASRQLAVWHFSDGVELETVDDNFAEVRDRSIEIAEEAALGVCPARRTEPPFLRIEPASTTLAPGKRLVYEITADLADAGETITATLTGPAVFDDGQQLAVVALDDSGTASLGVTSSAEGDSAIKVELPYRLEAGVVFAEIDPESPSQRLVMAQHLEAVAEAEANAVWFDDSTATPTAVPATATPSATQPAPSTEVPTETPIVTPLVTPSEAATASPTVTDSTPKPEKTTTTVQPTPVLPTELPRTGGGGGHVPTAVIALLSLGIVWLARRWLS